jgi:outer membrane protein assembly factor BamB
MTAESKPAPVEIATPAAKPARLIPGWPVRIIVALCLLAIVVMRTLPNLESTPFPWNDMAVANILTLIFGFVATMSLLAWFVFLSGHTVLLRRIVMAGCIGLVGTLAGLFRYEGVDGAMFPRFGPRWQPIADTTLGKVEVADEAPGADLAPTTADDFPQFLGPNRDCYLPGPELARDWTANPPQELWRRPIGAGWSAFAAVNGFAVTLEQRGPEEWVACYEIATGNPVWGHAITARHENPLGGIGPRSTPTIHNGRVYALGATGVLRCLDGKDGALLWQDDLRQRYGLDAVSDELLVQWGRAGSPLIVDDLVVVPAGGPTLAAKSLIAFQAETGQLAWEGGIDQIGYASPALATLAGIRQILIVNENSASGHDPKTGVVLWSHDWPGNDFESTATFATEQERLASLPGSSSQDASSSQPVPLPGDRVLLTKGYGGGAELLQFTPLADGSLLKEASVWRNKQALETKFTNVCVIDEHIYGLSNGYLECVELDSGRKTWRKNRRQEFGHGQILGVGDLILVLSEEGELALIEANPQQFVELARIPVFTDKTWNNLCLYGNKLLLRNDREAVCLELPLQGK